MFPLADSRWKQYLRKLALDQRLRFLRPSSPSTGVALDHLSPIGHRSPRQSSSLPRALFRRLYTLTHNYPNRFADAALWEQRLQPARENFSSEILSFDVDAIRARLPKGGKTLMLASGEPCLLVLLFRLIKGSQKRLTRLLVPN